MPTSVADITITSMRPRIRTSLGGATFDPVDSTVGQVISGTTTIYNAQITVSIYPDDGLPGSLAGVTTVSSSGRQPVTPEETAVFENSLFTPDEPTGSPPVGWTVLVPAGTLAKNKNYVILAEDSENFASASQGIHTAP